MKRLIILFVIFITANAVCLGQTYSGRIVNAEKNALSGVSVLLLDNKIHPVSFGKSDNNGVFSVNSPKGKTVQIMRLTKIGYESKDIPLKNFVNGMTYTLNKKAFELKEVKVTPDKTQQKGDTTTYLVSAYMQKQDRTIADVLKKIPGIEIKQDGQISVDGKAINKFYIEGMDLLGGKYSLASENIDAQKVSRVQVLHNHQPVRALQNVSFSQQAALNIVLKDDARNVWQGIVEAAGGHTLQKDGSWLRDGRLLAMLFARKKQSISMVKTNNTGKDISHEVTDFTQDNSELDDGARLETINLSAPQLEQHRYSFNNSEVFATNWLFKPSKDADLRVQIDGLLDKTEQNINRSTTFIDAGSDGITITEKQNAFSKRNEWNGELLYKLNSDRVYVNNTLKGYVDFNYSRGISLLNGTEVKQNVEPRHRFIDDKFQIISNINDRHSLTFNSRLHYGYLPGNLLLQDGNEERLGIHNFLWNISTSLRHKIVGFYVTWRVGADVNDQRQNVDNPLADNSDKYYRLSLYFGPTISYKSKALSIMLSTRLSWNRRRLDDEKRWQIAFQPSVMMEYKLNGYVTTDLNYLNTWTPYTLGELSSTAVFTDYMSLTQGIGALANSRIQNLSHSWRYSNPVRGLTANIGISYYRTSGMQLYSSSYTNGFYARKATGEESKADTYILNGRVSKSIGWGKLSLALVGSIGWYRYDLMLNSERSPLRQRYANAGIEVSWHPLSWLSAEEKSSINFNRQSSPSSAIDATSLRYFQHNLDLYFMPGKWQMECRNEFYHSNDKSISTNYFCDFKVSYRTKLYEIGVMCTNVFGTTDYERYVINSYTRMYTENVLRPRSILCFINFSI